MIIGMDFGTTNSGMSVYDGERLRLVPLDPASNNPYVARSALYMTNDRNAHVGRDATETYYEQNLNRPFKLERVRVGEVEMTFAEVGTFIRDVYVERDIFSPGRLFVSFKSGLSSPTYLGTVIGNYYYFLEDIIATYLYITRRRAEEYLQTSLDSIVLGRPVRFSDDDTQNEIARERLLQAAFRAGYQRVYLQYEPLAAAYHYEASIDTEHRALIFDFGGGTLDLSVVQVGNPRTRRVLATGGIPIAGDVFDQKIVRSKLPPHFGEGTIYRHGDQDLPIPNNFYEAFSNWQDLLTLQLPDRLEKLQNIAKTARARVKINAFIKLITSQYGLKLFDVAESGKRKLSERDRTMLRFKGPGFMAYDTITRSEFERLIRPDIRAIEARVDQVIQDAGVSYNDIDAVIRTGGSSQIPAFIDMLNERFGPEKVRDIDVFSSVTSGLGILAHEVEQGQADLTCYTPADRPTLDYLDMAYQGGIPVIDLAVVKKFVDVAESERSDEHDQRVLVLRTASDRFIAIAHPDTQFDQTPIGLNEIGLANNPQSPTGFFQPADRILLATNDYRVMVKTARQLADLNAIGIDLAESEGFRVDEFDRETVCMMVPWEKLANATNTVLISTLGYCRMQLGKSFIDKLNQPVGYQLESMRGYPAALVDVTGTGDLIVVSHAGRAVRIPVEKLGTLEQRILSVPLKGNIVGALYLEHPAEILVATASGYAKRIHSDAIPQTAEMNTSGEKVVTRANPVTVCVYEPTRPLWALTTRRLVPINQPDEIPLDNLETTSHRLLRLKQGESLVSLVNMV